MCWRIVFSICFLAASPTLAMAQSQVRYQLELFYTWSASTHPAEFPANAHMTKLFGATHNSRYVLFKDGDTPSSGLRLVAENGRNTVLTAEFAEAQRRKRIGSVFQGPDAPNVPARVSLEVEAGSKHPYVSFVTMIAPSPDWFTGVSGLALRQNDTWIEQIKFPLWAWDGGSDNAQTYVAANAETQPRQSVRLLTTEHFFDHNGLRAVGHGVLTLIAD